MFIILHSTFIFHSYLHFLGISLFYHAFCQHIEKAMALLVPLNVVLRHKQAILLIKKKLPNE